MSERTEHASRRVLHLASGTTHVVFDELAALIALALFPEDDMHTAVERVNLDDELKRAVYDGSLRVRDDPETVRRHSFPVGEALRRAVVTIGDLRRWLKARGVRVIVGDHGALAVTAPKPVPRRQAQEDAILAKLVEKGYADGVIPRAPPGKRSPVKQEVKGALRAALGYTDDIFDKAWQRLRKHERIRDA